MTARPTLSSPLLLTLLVLFTAGVLGCHTNSRVETQNGWPDLLTSEMGGMPNVSVSGDLWFGGLPKPADLELARRRGIETVVDVCTPQERVGNIESIEEKAKELGLKLITIPLQNDEALADETVDLVLDELVRAEARPTLIFCGTGARCALFFAIHRAAHQAVPLDQALLEARRAGMKPGGEEFVRAQVERLAE